MTVTIYHNPRCGKSRETLELLRQRGIAPKIVEYLKAPPSAAELKSILAMLGMTPRQLLRAKEAAAEGVDQLAVGHGGELLEGRAPWRRRVRQTLQKT